MIETIENFEKYGRPVAPTEAEIARAQAVLERSERMLGPPSGTTTLDIESWNNLLDMLENPPAPSESLRRIMKRER